MTGLLSRLVVVGLTSWDVVVISEGGERIITLAVTSGGGVMLLPFDAAVEAVVTVVGEGLFAT